MERIELVHDSTELRKMIQERPDLPIVVLADEESACPDWAWTYCSRVRCRIAQVLDIRTPYDDEDGIVFVDKDDFREAIEDYYEDAEPDYSGRTLEEAVEAEFKKYEEYWRDVIAIYASN